MAIFFLIFFTVYTALNYYVFIRGWQVLSSYPHLKVYYLILFVLIAFSYVIAKVFYNYLHPAIHDALIWIGSFWFAFLVYFILSLVVIDVVRFIGFKFSLFPTVISANYELVKQLTALGIYKKEI